MGQPRQAKPPVRYRHTQPPRFAEPPTTAEDQQVLVDLLVAACKERGLPMPTLAAIRLSQGGLQAAAGLAEAYLLALVDVLEQCQAQVANRKVMQQAINSYRRPTPTAPANTVAKA
jgi:hypothetical protein